MDSAFERLKRNMALAERASDLAAAMALVTMARKEGLLRPQDLAGMVAASTAPQMSALLGQIAMQLREIAWHFAALDTIPAPGSDERRELSGIQGHLHRVIELLRSILVCGGFAKEAASLAERSIRVPRRLPIGALLDAAQRKKDLQNDEKRALQAAEKQLQQTLARLADITPEMLLMAHLGMMAMAGFPTRPSTPQQARRKKRRRRRSNPFAPTASLRPAREEEED